MTPEEARLIAENYLHAGMHGAAETVRSLADQVEALQKDADRYCQILRMRKSDFIAMMDAANIPIHLGGETLSDALDRAREAT